MPEGMNYLHAKFQINILKNKKVIKLLELWTLWKRKKRKENSKYKRVVITTLKRRIANTIGCYHNSKNKNFLTRSCVSPSPATCCGMYHPKIPHF